MAFSSNICVPTLRRSHLGVAILFFLFSFSGCVEESSSKISIGSTAKSISPGEVDSGGAPFVPEIVEPVPPY